MDKFLKKKRSAQEEERSTSAAILPAPSVATVDGKKRSIGDEEPSTSAAKRPAPSLATVDGDVEELFATLSESWRSALAKELSKPYVKTLAKKVQAERSHQTVFPPAGMVYACLNMVPLAAVRVVILGQDPYHGDGQAHGLCFSVQRDVVQVPPSLKNIYKELATDIPGFEAPSHGNLEAWAQQGILLLNASLTVSYI